MSTAISISSNALIRLGANTINSFGDGMVEAIVADNLYTTTYRSLLSERRWSFAQAQAQLGKLTEAPKSGFVTVWQLPADFIRLIRVIPDYLNYGVYQNKLHVDSDLDELFVDYLFEPDEQDLPYYFQEYLELSLAAAFAIPVTDNENKSQAMMNLKNEAGRHARSVDSQQQQQTGFQNLSLLGVRN